MNVVKTVAKLRLWYHSNMLDVVNVANQLKLLSDKRADNSNRHHFMECVDCFERLGYDTSKVFGTTEEKKA